MNRRVITIITAITGDRVVIGDFPSSVSAKITEASGAVNRALYTLLGP